MHLTLSFTRPIALTALALAAISGAQAQTLYWAGTGGDVATAGSGQWDANTSIVWRDNSPAGTLVKWTDNQTAIFQGTVGGAVAVPGSISVAALQFASTAGAFTLTSPGSIDFTGAGISSESPNDQTINLQASLLSFTGSASAGFGTQSSRIKLTINGITTFSNTSTAGNATITNNGEMHFANQSSAGTSALTNNSLLIFEANSTSGAAAITNRGQLNFQDTASNFAAASFVNGNNGTIDISAVTTVGGVSFGALTSGAGSQFVLGIKRLTVAALNLANGGELSFDLGAGSRGNIVVTNSILGNPTAGGTLISLYDTGGLVAGQSLTLIDWTGSSSVLDLEASDFALQPLPGGFSGNLRVDGTKLVVDVLPEPGSLSALLMGGVALLNRRLRRR